MTSRRPTFICIRKVLLDDQTVIAGFHDSDDDDSEAHDLKLHIIILEPHGHCFTHVDPVGQAVRQVTPFATHTRHDMVQQTLFFRNQYCPEPYFEEKDFGDSPTFGSIDRKPVKDTIRWPIVPLDPFQLLNRETGHLCLSSLDGVATLELSGTGRVFHLRLSKGFNTQRSCLDQCFSQLDDIPSRGLSYPCAMLNQAWNHVYAPNKKDEVQTTFLKSHQTSSSSSMYVLTPFPTLARATVSWKEHRAKEALDYQRLFRQTKVPYAYLPQAVVVEWQPQFLLRAVVPGTIVEDAGGSMGNVQLKIQVRVARQRQKKSPLNIYIVGYPATSSSIPVGV